MTRNDIQVIIESPKDNKGRQHFSSEWIADNVGPQVNETGIRSQTFFTELSGWIKEKKSEGKNVIIVPKEQSKVGYITRNGKWIRINLHTWEPI